MDKDFYKKNTSSRHRMDSIAIYSMKSEGFHKFLSSLSYPLLLTIIILICVWVILPEHSLFGSEGDWFSQHVAIAEQFRTIFYETGQLLPDFSPAGAGSNIYDFSYYGLLRPDVLISFLLPTIPMGLILSAYAVLELIAGSILCYYWLNKHLSIPFFAFLGGVFYSCAGCFYQAHHQIMFVNYLPFLLLALLGIDRLLAKGKHGLLTLSLALAYLHSYYFAPAVLAVVFLYFLYRLYFEKKHVWERGRRSYWLHLFSPLVFPLVLRLFCFCLRDWICSLPGKMRVFRLPFPKYVPSVFLWNHYFTIQADAD